MSTEKDTNVTNQTDFHNDMIEIEKAIELSKSMMNISDGGSKCYDFGVMKND